MSPVPNTTDLSNPLYASGFTLPDIADDATAEPIHPGRLYRTRSGDIVRITSIDTRTRNYPVNSERITDDKDQFVSNRNSSMTHTMSGRFMESKTDPHENDLFECSRELWVRKYQSLKKEDPEF